MKKIKLFEATEEQIAKSIEMYPEDWGIIFPANHKKVRVEKDGDDLKVEIECSMVLGYWNPYVDDTGACATLTLRLENIDWNGEIWTEPQGKFVEDIISQVECLNGEITEKPVFVECHREMFLEHTQEVEEMLCGMEIGEIFKSVYTNEDLITLGKCEIRRTDISCEEVVEECETWSPDWNLVDYRFGGQNWSHVKFYIKVTKKDGEYSIEVVD